MGRPGISTQRRTRPRATPARPAAGLVGAIVLAVGMSVLTPAAAQLPPSIQTADQPDALVRRIQSELDQIEEPSSYRQIGVGVAVGGAIALLLGGLTLVVVRRLFAVRTARLEVTKEQIRSIIESQADGVIVLDTDGRMVFVNAKAERYLGRPREQLIGSSFGLPIVAGETTELELFRPDGTVLPVEMRSLEFMFEGRNALLANLRNISWRKEMEREREEAANRLHQSQKMEAVGQLTGGIAHDFNNILGVILGNLQLVQRQVVGDKRMERQIGRALAAVDRGKDLTKRLLAFSRKQTLEPKVIDPSDLIDDLLKLISRTLGGAIEVMACTQEDVWPVRIDPGQLENAILNLCVNARDAMPDGGTLTIETANVSVKAPAGDASNEIEPGDYVRLSITDTGVGMPESVRAMVFEPFFTTKEKGKGTGLGMSMVYGFVRQSGGQVSIYSEVGVGTTIRLYLPRAEGAVQRREGDADTQEEMPAGLPGGTETILLVDDNADLRMTIATLLTELGYTVIPAGSARQALAVINAGRPRIDLLFTDVVMPVGMDGIELTIEARKLFPDMPVLVQSGFTEKSLADPAVLSHRAEFMEKPADDRDIATAVRRLLDGA